MSLIDNNRAIAKATVRVGHIFYRKAETKRANITTRLREATLTFWPNTCAGLYKIHNILWRNYCGKFSAKLIFDDGRSVEISADRGKNFA